MNREKIILDIAERILDEMTYYIHEIGEWIQPYYDSDREWHGTGCYEFENGDWASVEFDMGDINVSASIVEGGPWKVDIDNMKKDSYYENIMAAVEKRLEPYCTADDIDDWSHL